MDNHPFLQKQGLVVRHQTVFPEYFVPIVIGGNEEGGFFEVTIEDGHVTENVKIQLEGSDPIKPQYEKYYQDIEYLRREGKFDKRFNVIREKWGIPIQYPEEFFRQMSVGTRRVYLADIVKAPELLNDIRELCKLVHMSADAPEKFSVVTAYLLFGELIFEQTGTLLFTCIQSTRLFKINEGSGYKLVIELKPSLNSHAWDDLYMLVKQAQERLETFVKGNGLPGVIEEVIQTNIPDEHKGCYVYAIPDSLSTLDNWRAVYKTVRAYLDSKVGKNYSPREKALLEKSKIIIEAVINYSDEVTKTNSEFHKLVADHLEITHPDLEVTGEDVRKAWDPYKVKRSYGENNIDLVDDFNIFDGKERLSDYGYLRKVTKAEIE